VTITRPGLYRVSAQVRWATDAVGYRRLEIRGPDQRRVAMDTRAAFANIQTIQGVSTDVAVTVPTVMSVWVAQTSGGALPLETGSPDRDAFFSIVRMA
jgi:hypothetical protein